MDRPVAWPLIATIGLRVLRGLAAAHEYRAPDNKLSPVIHRDVSPQNILLALNGDVKLADFGMARARDRIAEHTAPGFVKGTLSYMAPEILGGKPASPASDLFGVAATLWEALAGERLFQAKTDPEVAELIRRCEIPLIAERRVDVPGALSLAIRRALAADPGERFPSARAMAQEVGEVLRAEGPPHDADEIVAKAVSDAIETRKRMPPPG